MKEFYHIIRDGQQVGERVEVTATDAPGKKRQEDKAWALFVEAKKAEFKQYVHLYKTKLVGGVSQGVVEIVKRRKPRKPAKPAKPTK